MILFFIFIFVYKRYFTQLKHLSSSCAKQHVQTGSSTGLLSQPSSISVSSQLLASLLQRYITWYWSAFVHLSPYGASGQVSPKTRQPVTHLPPILAFLLLLLILACTICMQLCRPAAADPSAMCLVSASCSHCSDSRRGVRMWIEAQKEKGRDGLRPILEGISVPPKAR